MTRPTRYIVTLEAMPDPLGREPIQRLKQALKLLGRACGFRCTWIAQEPDRATDKTTAESHKYTLTTDNE